MSYRDEDFVHENGRFWVLREGKTYKVYQTAFTHSIRSGIFAIGTEDESRRRAIDHCNNCAEEDVKVKTNGPALAKRSRRPIGVSRNQLSLDLASDSVVLVA